MGRWRGLFLCVLSVVPLLGCDRGITGRDRAVGEAALAEAKALVAAYPLRDAGRHSREAAGWIAKRLPAEGTHMLPFDAPPGKLVNVLHAAHPAPVAILASHFDTKSGIPGFVGANDGASTTGLLIALAREARLPVHYLFLDGEECRVSYTASDGLHGSWFAARGGHRAQGLSKESGLPVIVLDMLGDKDFTPALAANGSHTLNTVLRRAAEELDIVLGDAGDVVDDHVPFVAEGWRATDIIDFDYGPNNAWWHTAEDTPDKLSAEALTQTAALVRKAITRLEKEHRQ